MPRSVAPEGLGGGRGVVEPECEDQNESYVSVEVDPKLNMSFAVRVGMDLEPEDTFCVRGREGLTD